jgi:hypothetical protein
MISFVRWVLFVPSGILAHIFVSAVLYNLQHAFGLFGAPLIFIRIFLATTCGLIIGSYAAPSRTVGRRIMLGGYLLLGAAVVFQLVGGVEPKIRLFTGSIEVVAMTISAICSYFVVREESSQECDRNIADDI